MRAVLDANVLISALIGGGKPRGLMMALLGQRHALILSEGIIAEFSRVSSDEKMRKHVDDDEIASFLGEVLSRAAFVLPEGTIPVLGDADDNILAAARAGAADVLVTGDKHLLALGKHGHTRVVTVARAVSLPRRQRRVSGRRAKSDQLVPSQAGQKCLRPTSSAPPPECHNELCAPTRSQVGAPYMGSRYRRVKVRSPGLRFCLSELFPSDEPGCRSRAHGTGPVWTPHAYLLSSLTSSVGCLSDERCQRVQRDDYNANNHEEVAEYSSPFRDLGYDGGGR
ncbi:MAG: putative toxin-antitoxin system toxin component, PIN family [Nitrososphaerota archaeon]|nr:putative toxin-antitoxin system toxin component, PIN family [Nitrososphaerota archaeon]MDG7022889.1 putative toxin-antitoxin system toxin component, PIN family [Nitrososphaerota archaeon]